MKHCVVWRSTENLWQSWKLSDTSEYFDKMPLCTAMSVNSCLALVQITYSIFKINSIRKIRLSNPSNKTKYWKIHDVVYKGNKRLEQFSMTLAGPVVQSTYITGGGLLILVIQTTNFHCVVPRYSRANVSLSKWQHRVVLISNIWQVLI